MSLPEALVKKGEPKATHENGAAPSEDAPE